MDHRMAAVVFQNFWIVHEVLDEVVSSHIFSILAHIGSIVFLCMTSFPLTSCFSSFQDKGFFDVAAPLGRDYILQELEEQLMQEAGLMGALKRKYIASLFNIDEA